MTTVTQILNQARKYIGVAQGSATHKAIIDKYNSVKPLPVGYAVKYTDDWCDAFITTLAIETGAVDIIGRECGVQRHIDIFKAKGIWIEDGTITPKAGDIITFNWDEYNSNNNGFADHIGIVESVANGQITTIEGNTDRAVRRRTYQIGNGYIRGFARPKYAAETTTTPANKSNDTIANEVIAGEWSSGQDRINKLTNAGYNAQEVQNRVNTILGASAAPVKPTLKPTDTIAKEVVNGDWGSGQDRFNRLANAGYNAQQVQNRVNELLGATSKPQLKSIDTVAREVLAGQWGNGADRKARLEKAGYNYNQVQSRVNQLA